MEQKLLEKKDVIQVDLILQSIWMITLVGWNCTTLDQREFQMISSVSIVFCLVHSMLPQKNYIYLHTIVQQHKEYIETLVHLQNYALYE